MKAPSPAAVLIAMSLGAVAVIGINFYHPLVLRLEVPTTKSTLRGVVKSVHIEANGTLSSQVASILLTNGSLVEATVLPSCPVQVGQDAQVIAIQPFGFGAKQYVVAGSVSATKPN